MSTAIPDSDADRFYQSQRAALLGDASITEKKMFGTTALCVGGKVFMFPWRDTLVVKIPASQVDELIAAAHAKRFDPGHGRTSATWAAVFASASDQWPRLAQEARVFVGG
jgi:TfoX/Sxy family transcriptional regulator of competence genes